METYQYQPIENARSIRILQLEPSTHHDPTTRCTLKEVSLHSSPSYEAVSYTWGSPARTEPIDCEGKMLLVTKNCLELLRQFRPVAGAARALWIDAICINQESEGERTQQVQLMGDIYTDAEQVLIWLGEADHESSLALSYLAKIAARIIPDREIELCKTVADELDKMEFRDLRQIIKAITKTFSRPWFSRMWTLQELVLGTEVTVSCGQDSMSWDCLVLGTYFIDQALFSGQGSNFVEEESAQAWHTIYYDQGEGHGREEALEYSALSTFGYLDRARRAVAKMKGLELPRMPKPMKEGYMVAPAAQPLSFRHLLNFLHYKQTADPKDKIFSLYGIAQALNMKMSKPDYSHSLAKIYTDAARAAILHDESLDLLQYAIIYAGGSLPGAPSWVPDWSRPPAELAIGLRGSQPARDSLPEFAFSADGQQLTLAGILVDEIVIRERPTANYKPIDIRQDPRQYLEVFPAIRDWYAQIRARYEAGESAKEVFFQTVMRTSALHSNYKQDDLEWFRDHFEEWFLLMSDDNLTTAEALKISLNQFLKKPGEEYERIGFLGKIGVLAEGKAYFVTEKGYIGQSVYKIEVGDVLVVFAGMTAPCVIRRSGGLDLSHKSYQFLGPAYAHGIMYGEAWDERSGHLEEFTLV